MGRGGVGYRKGMCTEVLTEHADACVEKSQKELSYPDTLINSVNNSFVQGSEPAMPPGQFLWPKKD